ncbi:hypothetical protein Bca4012_056352 [Brassica carinata]|uniref:YTH domain-containing family protein n=1 Tax=Brassica carinata TaxID=52824 RepID=A0A8X7VYT9_BRACI|nr:hypothetical protein Bca52824_013826 [Brassica carinata]
MKEEEETTRYNCANCFPKTQNLRNPYNENLPVNICRDCQELEPSVGEELASLLYLEPDSELMLRKPNDEEEEEEDDSEEEEDGMASGPQGRGRGMLWPPQMSLGCGIKPMPGMGGFPLGVMTPADGFPYEPGGYNGPVPGMMFPGRPRQQFPHGGYGMMGRGPVMGGMGNAAP